MPDTTTQWDDAIRYSAWVGLRPMTELEFEKACRGPLATVDGEFPWGDTLYAIMYHSGNKESTGRETAAGAGRCVSADNARFNLGFRLREYAGTIDRDDGAREHKPG